MAELWQLYDESSKPLEGKGATKDEVYKQGLLHGAAHVWIWRHNAQVLEVLLQKRGLTKPTWPGLLDISAAGHIDLGEEPLQAAIRETEEEVGLNIDPADFNLVKIDRQHLVTPNGNIENEFCWIYTVQMPEGANINMIQDGELDNILWKPLTDFRKESLADNRGKIYVPHGRYYYELVVDAIVRDEGGRV